MQTSPQTDSKSEDLIAFNIGGTEYLTTADTLNAAGHSFFSGLQSGRFGVQRDSKGRIFIDRDPKLFRCVLNYLRSQCTQLSISDSHKSKLLAVLAEAQFFQIEPLIEEIEDRLRAIEEKEKMKGAPVVIDKSFGTFGHFAPPPPSSVRVVGPAQGPSEASPTAAPQMPTNDIGGDAEPAPAHDTQGRGYQEAEHSELIRRAATTMDFDF